MASVRNVQLENTLKVNKIKFKQSGGGNGLEYLICCPYCRKNVGKVDKKYKLTINAAKEVWRCWRCGESGTLKTLFPNIKSKTKQAQVEILKPLPTNILSPGDLVPLSELSDEHVAIQYLKNRKFNPSVLDSRYGVRFCRDGITIGNIFNTTNTIVFPVWMGGAVIGWQARLLFNPDEIPEDQYEVYNFTKDSDGEYNVPPKYMTSPGFDKGRVLYNYDLAKTEPIVVICEGTFDAIRVGPCAVATFGKGVSEYQERLIKSYWKFAILLLDPGDTDMETLKLQQSLSLSIPCISVKLQGYKDAGETPTNEIWRQIRTQLDRENIDLEKVLN